MHVPRTTVREAIYYSGRLRLADVSREVLQVRRGLRAAARLSDHAQANKLLVCSEAARAALRHALCVFAQAFVDEVMDLVELGPQADALVGLPGLFGLSVEARKRLTVSVARCQRG